MVNRIRISFNHRTFLRTLFRAGVARRHRHWANRVALKFQLQPGRALWQPQDFVHTSAGAWFVRQNLHRSQLLHPHFNIEFRIAHTLKREVLLSPMEQASSQTRMIAVPQWNPIEKLILSPLASQSEHTRMLATTIHSSTPTHSFVRLLRSEKRVTRVLNELETVFNQTGERIIRKLQRVESRTGYFSSELTCAPASTASRSGLVFESATPISSMMNHQRNESESTAISSAVPSPNIGAITDEVMRQIDRRLIATRERMGKM